MSHGGKDKYTDEKLKENGNRITLKTVPKKGLIVNRNMQIFWEFKARERCWIRRKNNFQQLIHMASPAAGTWWRLVNQST